MEDEFHNFQLSDFPSAKIKIDQLFNEWLIFEGESILENLSNVRRVDPKLSVPIHDSAISHGGPPRSPNKKSPKKRSQSEMLSHRLSSNVAFERVGPERNIDNELEDPLHLNSSSRRRSNFDSIPRFYAKGQSDRSYTHRIDEDQLSKRFAEIEAFFQPYPSGVPVEKFVHVTKKLCGIPSFFNLPLCKRIKELYGNDNPTARPVSRTAKRQTAGITVNLKHFLQFWQHEIEPFNRVERFFRVIKQPGSDFICKDDFAPFIQELLHFHPGLDFLEAHEEFQRKYALTVVTRIFFKVNTSRTGKLSLREVRNSNLFNEFMHVDEETDINRITEYFSYEHFYVLYCRFFELDSDKDSKISREDLQRYNDNCLSEEIVDRIFQVGIRMFSDGFEGGYDAAGGMTYPDFVVFMLAEEDRSSIPALKYWFCCCDLDGDGKLTPEEMWHFYRTQLQRVTSLGQEAILFQDVICQMVDFIGPSNPRAITIDDLIRSDKRHISGVLFDVLFNLHKFLRFETRDPFQEKQKREDMFNCDWDRFAYLEYHRLAAEEENCDTGNYDGGFESNSLDKSQGDMDVDFDSGAKYTSPGWDGDEEDDFDDQSRAQTGKKGNASKGGGGTSKGVSKSRR